MNVLKKEKALEATKGFTIIEVVLVLAIAGLIFLMVFIALPALQASQRDTARKNDTSAIAAAITSYTGNNRGVFPTTTQLTGNAAGTPDATSEKFGGYITSVSSNTTSVVRGTDKDDSVDVKQGEVIVIKGAVCAASAAATGSGSEKTAKQELTVGTTRQFVVVTYLEAGSGTSYCLDS